MPHGAPALATLLCAGGYGAGGQGSAYEDELIRRQYEYQQQQRLRQAAMQQQASQAQQQAMFQAQVQQAQREALLAQQRQGGGGGAGASYGGRPMSGKEKKQLKKQQEAQAKAQKKLQAQRQKAFKSAQRSASKRGAMGVQRRRGPLSLLLSFKGIAVAGGVGYMWLMQRPLLNQVRPLPPRPSSPAGPPPPTVHRCSPPRPGLTSIAITLMYVSPRLSWRASR